MRRSFTLIRRLGFLSIMTGMICGPVSAQDKPGPIPGTTLLEKQGDIASSLVDGVDRFLDEQLKQAVTRRRESFRPDTSSVEAYLASIEPKRQRLAKMLGVIDPLEKFQGFHSLTTTTRSDVIFQSNKIVVRTIRWPVLRGVEGEGLLIEPIGLTPKGGLVYLPHATQTPEQLLDLDSPHTSEALIFAHAGYRIVIPTVIDYGTSFSITQGGKFETGLTHREFCYRPSFELGRHLIGYEVQKAIAAVNGLKAEGKTKSLDFPVNIYGRGDGGLVALFAAAISPDINLAIVSGRDMFTLPTFLQPINRNIFGLSEELGLAELFMLVAPRKIFLTTDRVVTIPFLKAGGRGAPVPGLQREYPDSPEGKASRENDLRELYAGYIRNRPIESEIKRWKEVVPNLNPKEVPYFENGSSELLTSIKVELNDPLIDRGTVTIPYKVDESYHQERMKRQVDQIIADTQYLLEESSYVRDTFWEKTRPAREAHSVQDWVKATESYREYFNKDVIGRFDLPKLPLHPRTRVAYEEPTYTAYEVVIDVFPDVISYGLLLVPKGIKEGERRPVVVCQHGLEGRPQDLADPKINNPAYNQFGCRLAERGFVVFAPQNLYIFHDRFRVLQRKLNPLGKTLFSIIIPQHEQILAWLSSLSYVDAKRIGFYGLSYGGKSAMRIPAALPQYALSICSADFNDWIWKNASTRSPYSYVGSPEYEIFEFDLGMTFNYSEMAGLIAPRPFMVERGHHDGVAPDDRVASEFAKVKRLYVDLRIPERARIEFFDGPHTIHGVGTFEFLHQYLDWPSPADPKPLDGQSQ